MGRWVTVALASMLVSSVGVGCGGGSSTSSAVRSPEDEGSSRRQRSGGPEVSSEVGGLDEAKVNETFEQSIGALQKCLSRGASRIEFLGGAVSFFIEVGSDGSVSHAHLEQSTLGDRKTEKCMLSALQAKTWPKPIGGKVGLARKSFDFDPPNDVRPPTDWEAQNVEPVLEKKSAEIAECKSGSSGTFTATLYVDTEGSPISVGVTPPDAAGESAVDCLVELLKDATYPSPGSWPAKVTFQL